MSLPLPTNATVSIERKGVVVASAVAAVIHPARPEIVMMREVPAGKAFEVYFTELVDVKEQDFLVDGAKRYRVVGVAHYDTPPAQHTEVVAEARWGTES
jgi:hypothetical protein